MLIVSLGWCFWLDTTGRAKVVVFERLSTGADTLTNGHWGWLMTSLGWHGTFQQPLSRARFLMATDTHTRADTHTVWWKNSSCTELSYIPACLCVCVHQVDIEQPQLSQYIQSEQLRTHTLTHTQREKTRERETEREGKRKGKGEERDTDGKWEKDRERKLAQWPCHLSINQVATWALSLLSLPLSLSLTHTHFQQYCSNREKDIWLFGLDDNSIL